MKNIHWKIVLEYCQDFTFVAFWIGLFWLLIPGSWMPM